MEREDREQLNNKEPHQKWKKYLKWINYVSVEPTMWLYMMAYMITSVVEQAFFVHKACRVDHGYSEEVCAKLNDNDTIKAQVQITVSEFHQWDSIVGHVFPIVLALFFGNWSDRHGRKLPLILGLLGKFIYSFMIVINSMMDTWNLNTVIYTATLPMGMLGADVAIFGCAFAYISDVSSVEYRTLRITILDVVYLSTMPTGIALGSYLFTNVVKSSYTIMFIINSTLLALAILYSVIRLKWQTLPQQQPLTGVNLLTDFFDKKHVVATVRTMTKARPKRGRLQLWLLLVTMMLYTFQREEKAMSYLYTQLKFKWGVTEFSTFRTFQSVTFVIAILFGVPIMSKLLRINDTFMVVIGAFANIAGRAVFALAKVPQLFYVGAVVSALGPIIAPIIRSMSSKHLPVEERGKLFAMLAVCDNAVPLISGVLYSRLYSWSINTAPASIYWLTFVTQIFIVQLITIFYGLGRRNSRYVTEEDTCPADPLEIENSSSNSEK